jgi:hypothetical protein
MRVACGFAEDGDLGASFVCFQGVVGVRRLVTENRPSDAGSWMHVFRFGGGIGRDKRASLAEPAEKPAAGKIARPPVRDGATRCGALLPAQ